MNHDSARVMRALRIGNGVAALAVSASLLGLLRAGAGSVPPLGRVLVPGYGACTWRYLLLPAATRPDAASRPPAPGVSGGSRASVGSGGSRASVVSGGSRASVGSGGSGQEGGSGASGGSGLLP